MIHPTCFPSVQQQQQQQFAPALQSEGNAVSAGTKSNVEHQEKIVVDVDAMSSTSNDDTLDGTSRKRSRKQKNLASLLDDDDDNDDECGEGGRRQRWVPTRGDRVIIRNEAERFESTESVTYFAEELKALGFESETTSRTWWRGYVGSNVHGNVVACFPHRHRPDHRMVAILFVDDKGLIGISREGIKRRISCGMTCRLVPFLAEKFVIWRSTARSLFDGVILIPPQTLSAGVLVETVETAPHPNFKCHFVWLVRILPTGGGRGEDEEIYSWCHPADLCAMWERLNPRRFASHQAFQSALAISRRGNNSGALGGGGVTFHRSGEEVQPQGHEERPFGEEEDGRVRIRSRRELIVVPSMSDPTGNFMTSAPTASPKFEFLGFGSHLMRQRTELNPKYLIECLEVASRGGSLFRGSEVYLQRFYLPPSDEGLEY